MAVSLLVTPGATISEGTTVDAAKLNQIANPQVEIPDDAEIPLANLPIAELLSTYGDTIAGKNWLPYCNFWPHQWEDHDGVNVAIVSRQMNATGWYCQWWSSTPTTPSDLVVQYARLLDAPDGKSSFCAEIIGNADCDHVEFGVWIPSAICSQLAAETELTISVYVKNATGADTNTQFVLYAAAQIDELDRISDAEDDTSGIASDGSQTADDSSDLITLENGEWTRCTWTFDPTAITNFKNGCFIALFTSALTSDTKSFQFAQAQLEIGPAATVFKRPQMPPVDYQPLIALPYLTPEERLLGGDLMVQLSNGDQRRLGPPPESFNRPAVGWASGCPTWIDTDPVPDTYVFTYTGLQQKVTVPAGKTSMTVKCWGAGGSQDGGIPGGVGGYTTATIAVTAGDEYAVIVGQGQHDLKGWPFGFGGYGQGPAHQHNGGGLSGVFTGSSPVTDGDTARAVAIAGGGGSAGQSGGGRNGRIGGNGNDTGSAGGMSTMLAQGATGGVSSGGGGGGGGYAGGASWGLGGKGGTGFTVAGATGTAVTGAAYPSQSVPNSSDADYDGSAGQQGKPGLVVVSFA